MSVINNNLLLTAPAAASATGVSRSLRFSSGDSSYLSRTPSITGNQKTWTWAGWVKRSVLGISQSFIGSFASGPSRVTWFGFNGSDQLVCQIADGSSNTTLSSTSVYRDPGAWMHVVLTCDTTQATAASRLRFYVNGSEVSSYGGSYPPQNTNTLFNSTSFSCNIGQTGESGYNYYLSGYLADCFFCDGNAYDPSYFTTTDATTGQLIPKAYTGTYGTNGFHLDFADNSAATATTLGKDSAGSNNWTPNNFSVTAGAGNDSLVDVPTNGAQTDTGVGGEVRGNYCTLNPLNSQPSAFSNGNLQYSTTSIGKIFGTIAVNSGKWYWEAQNLSSNSLASMVNGIGRVDGSPTTYGGGSPGDYAWLTRSNSGSPSSAYNNGNLISYGNIAVAQYAVVGIAFNADAGTLEFFVEGVSQGVAWNTIPVSSSLFYAPIAGDPNSSTDTDGSINFGQRPFAYTAPSGFKALCTANLPAPLVTKPNTVMDVKLYTGNGGTQTISGLGFSPDFVWLKNRSSGSYGHRLVDSVRGSTLYLMSHNTGAEATDTNGVTAFNSDGFSLGNSGDFNVSSNAFVAWTWDAGTSTVTNTQGSITSSVRANPTAGFSIVGYTGNGTSGATVGHGLGVAPSLIIIKERSQSTGGWITYHASVGATGALYLNGTAATITASGFFNNTAPTSTVFSLGNSGELNDNGQTNIAYCFTPVVGYSSFGSYTGNGSATDGPFVYTGMRPKWILVKRTDAADDWPLMDTVRTPANPQNAQLWPNFSTAESNPVASSRQWDALSNGFKIRGDNAAINFSGATYIYAAFAEMPFNYSRAR